MPNVATWAKESLKQKFIYFFHNPLQDKLSLHGSFLIPKFALKFIIFTVWNYLELLNEEFVIVDRL